MGFVEENSHDPCGKECQPSDGDHHMDLVLCQLMGKTVDINEPHVGGHTLQSCYCQTASKDVSFSLLKTEFSLPQVERGHYQEVNGLLDHCGLMSGFIPIFGFLIFL